MSSMKKNKLESKRMGALYGFIIGDAMGATTEFMNKSDIKKKYGKVTNIIGGGWLNLSKGQVTDDSEMMLCTLSALIKSNSENEFLKLCCLNYRNWYLSVPVDIGKTCAEVISKNIISTNPAAWIKSAKNQEALGNGSLMRALPTSLLNDDEEYTIKQGRLTHNNRTCDSALQLYHFTMNQIIKGVDKSKFYSPSKLSEPYGHVINTLVNSLYWLNKTDSFEDAIIGAVNDGGDADTIAAITGSLAGAYYGYDAIPKRWIKQLDVNVKNDIDSAIKLIIKK